MIGKYNRRESWEKCSVYDLDNGWQAAIQHNQCYGEFVSRLSKDGKHWYASDGYDNPYGTDPDPIMQKVFKDHIALPEFAKPWIEVINKTSEQTLVRPRFTKEH
jgi:hypothetical protein